MSKAQKAYYVGGDGDGEYSKGVGVELKGPLILRVPKWGNDEVLYGSNRGHAGIDWSFMRDLRVGEFIALNAGYSYAHLRAKYYGIKIRLRSLTGSTYNNHGRFRSATYSITRIK